VLAYSVNKNNLGAGELTDIPTMDLVQTYLFHGRDLRRVLPGRTCDIGLQRRNAISRHA